MAEKLQIENDLQKCIKLKESKADLISSNQQYEREIEEAREQIQPLEVSYNFIHFTTDFRGPRGTQKVPDITLYFCSSL
jgi:hypothetical protein